MAVEAHVNMDTVYEYFRTVHDWNSWDGKGTDLFAFVHLDKDLNNAFWSSYTQSMFFGDGDGWLHTPLTTCLDVAGHEFSHAIISATVDLVYQLQSGALNEHIADFWGMAVDAAAGGNAQLLAEHCMGPGAGVPALRDMAHPEKGQPPQPAHMTDFMVLANDQEHDNGGVHFNSGIPNKAAWLMADAAGFAAIEAVYMTFLVGKYIGKNGSFAEYAEGMMAACAQSAGAGSAICQAVQGGLEAVGIPVEGGGTDVACPPNAEVGGDGFCHCKPGFVYDGGEAACVEDGCGGVPPTGQCQGTVVAYCAGGQVKELDCAEFGQICGFDTKLGSTTCVAKKGCGEVPAEGRCVGGLAQVCEDGQLTEYDCAFHGFECGQLESGSYGCLKKEVTCTPSCDGKACGGNGCGGSCGVCAPGESCDDAGKCVVGSTAPCGTIGEGGICAGTWMVYCSALNLASLDCAAMSMGCTTDGLTAACSSTPAPKTCGDWTPLGGCVGDLLVRCRGGVLSETPCALSGGECFFDTASSEFGCQAGPTGGECGLLTEEGQCDGDLVRYCAAGQLVQMYCPAHAAGCAMEDGVGFRCLASACKPQCEGKTCGDDGCGGSCGTCPEDGSTPAKPPSDGGGGGGGGCQASGDGSGPPGWIPVLLVLAAAISIRTRRRREEQGGTS